MADETTSGAAPQTSPPTAEQQAAAPPVIKTRKPKQRACDEKDAKAKLCNGHLKRWYDYPDDIKALIGPQAEIYRCEFCKTLYRPDPAQQPHSYTLRF
jgi:hypothetical protein